LRDAAVSVVALAGAATASACANALPGDTLYPVKQIGEQVALATAGDDAAHQDVLFLQAETRLDETSRLLEQGREVDAGHRTLRYSEAFERTADGAIRDGGCLQADRAHSLTCFLPRRHRHGLACSAPLPQPIVGWDERGLNRSRRPISRIPTGSRQP
jgi:hypothetical protein